MHTTGVIWGQRTTGPDKPRKLRAHSGKLSGSSPSPRKSTGDSPVLPFGRIEFQRRCTPFRLCSLEMNPHAEMCSVSRQMRRRTTARFCRETEHISACGFISREHNLKGVQRLWNSMRPKGKIGESPVDFRGLGEEPESLPECARSFLGLSGPVVRCPQITPVVCIKWT